VLRFVIILVKKDVDALFTAVIDGVALNDNLAGRVEKVQAMVCSVLNGVVLDETGVPVIDKNAISLTLRDDIVQDLTVCTLDHYLAGLITDEFMPVTGQFDNSSVVYKMTIFDRGVISGDIDGDIAEGRVRYLYHTVTLDKGGASFIGHHHIVYGQVHTVEDHIRK